MSRYLITENREKSSQGVQDLGELTRQQNHMLATLGQVEQTTQNLNQNLIQFLSNASSAPESKNNALVQNVWSSAWSAQHTELATDDLWLNTSENTDEFCANAIIESLKFQGVDSREAAISKAYEQTYEWVFEEPQEAAHKQRRWSSFVSWLQGTSANIYWITGKAGAGKSTLMKFMVGNPSLHKRLARWSRRSNKPLLIASYYFWNASTVKMQKSQEGLMRSLLAQFLTKMPSIVARVCPRRWALLKIFGQHGAERVPAWTLQELSESFALFSLAVGDKFNVALFIDGLDEFDGNHSNLIEFVKLLHSRPGTKICVSSRPWVDFLDAFHDSPQLRMEDLTTDDIGIFARGKFEETLAFRQLRDAMPSEAHRLMNGIAEKAGGVFLWVSIVVHLLREGLTEGDSLQDLQNMLDTLPSDISDLYKSIWRGIKPQYIGHASRLFQVHNCSTLPLDVITLWLADEENTLDYDINIVQADLQRHIVQIMTRRLDSRTRGLLEISIDGTVDYLHRTVREWILPIWPDICAKSPPSFDPHLQLLKALTVESSSSSLWAGHGILMPVTFWQRVSMCFHHASHILDTESNVEPLVRALDRLDADLSQVSKMYPLSDGTLPLYRNTAVLGMTMTAADAEPLPHWATTQYTQTDSSLHNTFIGLCAQFGVLPYVREKITHQPDLLKLPAKTHSVLACAVFGPEHFGRPDVIDAMSRYLTTTSFDTRLALVCLLLEHEVLTLLPEQLALCPRDQATWNEVQQKVEFFNGRANQEQFKMQCEYWDAVSKLFDEHVQNLVQRSRAAPRTRHKAEPKTTSIFRLLKKLKSKVA